MLTTESVEGWVNTVRVTCHDVSLGKIAAKRPVATSFHWCQHAGGLPACKTSELRAKESWQTQRHVNNIAMHCLLSSYPTTQAHSATHWTSVTHIRWCGVAMNRLRKVRTKYDKSRAVAGKPREAMRPIRGCPENFRDSLTMPTATIPKIFHGLLFRSTLWMFLQKSVALPVPEIIGGSQKIWAAPGYAHAPFSPKFLKGFYSEWPCKYIPQIWSP